MASFETKNQLNHQEACASRKGWRLVARVSDQREGVNRRPGMNDVAGADVLDYAAPDNGR
jgi:hypothetical protein